MQTSASLNLPIQRRYNICINPQIFKLYIKYHTKASFPVDNFDCNNKSFALQGSFFPILSKYKYPKDSKGHQKIPTIPLNLLFTRH